MNHTANCLPRVLQLQITGGKDERFITAPGLYGAESDFFPFYAIGLVAQ